MMLGFDGAYCVRIPWKTWSNALEMQLDLLNLGCIFESFDIFFAHYRSFHVMIEEVFSITVRRGWVLLRSTFFGYLLEDLAGEDLEDFYGEKRSSIGFIRN